MAETSKISVARTLLETVPDPEIPSLSVVEMGMIGGLWLEDGVLQVDLLPTYSGCPAVRAISDEIVRTLEKGGFAKVRVEVKTSPAWSTDFLGEDARKKLAQCGIAPPEGDTPAQGDDPFAARTLTPECPLCHSKRTVTVSEFGSTACKSLHRCEDCRQPFEHFKRF